MGRLVPLASRMCFYGPAEGALLPQGWDEITRGARGGICRFNRRGAMGKGGTVFTSEAGRGGRECSWPVFHKPVVVVVVWGVFVFVLFLFLL